VELKMARESLKNIIRILTLTCDQSSELMSRSQEKPLTGSERWALSFHLMICRFCRKYKRQLKLMREVLGKMAESDTYEAEIPPLLDTEQKMALQDRLSKKIRDNLDSM
jgi:hypothetical protein